MTQALPAIGVDTETYPIDIYQLAPKLVCLTTSDGNHKYIAATGDPGTIPGATAQLFDSADNLCVKVFHNAGFDLAVMCAAMPELFPVVFDHIDRGLIEDTITREKLLNLADTGDLDFATLPGGGKMAINYKLHELVRYYFGVDISGTKNDEDAWRMHYRYLDGVPTAEWPENALSYALDDPDWTIKVRNEQEKRRYQLWQKKGIDPLATQVLQVQASFALYLMTCQGICVDAAEKQKIEAMLEEELKPENINLLIEHNILCPEVPPQPYANGAKNKDGTPKMTAAKPEKINAAVLREYIKGLSQKNPDRFTIKMTKKSTRHPEGQISFDAEWMEEHAGLDPVLSQYYHRQKLQKLVTTYLPAMNDKTTGKTSPVVYFAFNTLVSTGRTSSFSHSLVPSTNGQNIDYRVRNCFIPRPGFVLCSTDYSGMEHVTQAQKCLNLFGYSKLAELLNNDIDAHEYLGAQIAYYTDTNFKNACLEGKPHGLTQDEIYQVFHRCKKSDQEPIKAFWKHYRTLAKPTGLGYPGGLGPKTFIVYAKTTFGVDVDFETATQLRELWRQTFPEVVEYHAWINNACVDPFNEPRIREDEHGNQRSSKQYAYTSPLGMLRAGCDFCAAANGAALQTPSSEGSKIAVYNTVRSCYDSTRKSILYPDAQGVTCRPVVFVHDELLTELRYDDQTHERAMAVSQIMVNALKVITPDVKVKAEPALMWRWDKRAESVYDEAGRLIPWTPKEN